MSRYEDLPGSREPQSCSGCGYPVTACECESLFGDDPYAPRPSDVSDDGGED